MNAWIAKLKKCSKEYQDEKKNKIRREPQPIRREPVSNYKRLPKRLSTPTKGLDKLANFIHDKEKKQYIRQNLNMARKLK